MSKPVPLWNIANVLTIVRVALVPVLAVVLMAAGGQDPVLRWISFAIFAAAAITDHIDGELARRRGLVTDFGKIMDPIADKLLVGTALVSLAALAELPWWVPAVIIVREVGITVWRLTVMSKRVIPADRGGKLKTLLQVGSIGLFIMPLWTLPPAIKSTAWVLLWAAIGMTIISGINYVYQAYRIRPGQVSTP